MWLCLLQFRRMSQEYSTRKARRSRTLPVRFSKDTKCSCPVRWLVVSLMLLIMLICLLGIDNGKLVEAPCFLLINKSLQQTCTINASIVFLVYLGHSSQNYIMNTCFKLFERCFTCISQVWLASFGPNTYYVKGFWILIYCLKYFLPISKCDETTSVQA